MAELTENKIFLLGRTGDKPPMTGETSAGKMWARFSLCTHDGWGEKEEDNWHNIIAWGKYAEIVKKHAKPGTRMYIVGFIQYKKQGKAYYTNIVIQDMIMLGKPVPELKQIRDEDVGRRLFGG